MALKRSYENSEKYLYLKVSNVSYDKDNQIVMALKLLEKQDAVEAVLDPDTQEIITPAVDAVESEVNMLSYSLNKSQPDFDANFGIAKLDELNVNIVSQCYLWIKENVDLFRDFSDC